jgi:hypothetical protein
LRLSLIEAQVQLVSFAFQNGNVRQMAGIRSLIQSNVTDASSASVTATMINDSLQSIYEKGGFASGGDYKILVPAKQKRAISEFDSNKLYITQAENVRGKKVDHFVSDFGQFEITLNNNLAASELMIVDANRMAIRPLVGREFFHKYMGDKGDYTVGTLVGKLLAA